MNVLVFEDALVHRLYPITTGRPASQVTCASYTLQDWLLSLYGPHCSWVRPHLRPLLKTDHPDVCHSLRSEQSLTLAINARLVPAVSNLSRLQQFAERGQVGKVRFGNAVAAAIVPTERLNEFQIEAGDEGQLQLSRVLDSLPDATWQLELLDYPHDVIRCHLSSFAENINHRLRQGGYREIADGVFVAGGVAISDFVVTNTKAGPIVIEDQAAIGPFCFLRGPIHIGRNSRINEYTSIKDAVSIGHTTKIGGEVEGSVIESYSNKQHHGFLGHSYLGSWINLGAGTCNSDLKNTYGEVKMDYSNDRVATGMQFLGCIIGDYSKTAINTSIFTGKTIGVCSMLYGFVTTNVPSFVNYARSFSQVTESPPSVMEATQRRMFQRRNVQQRTMDVQLLHAMYELTRQERQMSEEPLSL